MSRSPIIPDAIIDHYGYVLVWYPDHPRACSGRVKEHIIIVEKALGHYIDTSIEVHHHDEDKGNNSNTNLVACNDRQYHQLIHVRTKIFNLGLDPNLYKMCSSCRGPVSKTMFHKNRRHYDGLHNNCMVCRSNKKNI